MEVLKMKSQRGFTLAEMAIVVLLISIAMTMGLKMVTAKLESAAYSETKSRQEQIKIALLGYLRTNKKLPCPDNSDNTVVATGDAAATCHAAATDGYGIVPWKTLGIPRDAALDGWGNYFTYRVANGIAGAKNWTSTTLVTPFDTNELTTQTNALTIQELNVAGDALVATTAKAVVVILSHGKNGKGAKTIRGVARITGAGGDEATNATLGAATFVLRPYTESTAAFGGAYDDVVAYMLPKDLLQPLISEGTLKACYAYCVSAPAYSACSDNSGTCAACAAVGNPGVVGTCTGTCGTCAFPATASCSATGIPIGNSAITCL